LGYAMHNKRNKYDKRDCLEIGQEAEAVFAGLAAQKGWRVTAASNYANVNDHWDVLIEKGSERYRVDVKGMKRVNRRDSDAQDEWIWIELHGVREHDRGWLYDGKAELVAFEKKGSLRAARYKVYSRPGRLDKITMVEMEKLASIRCDEWPKTQ
jgi:hypothetical protein